MNAPTAPSESLFTEGWEDTAPPGVDTGPPGWEEPIPLGEARTLPAFPSDALPKWLGAMVDAVAEETQTPADLAGSLALAVLAAAGGGRAVVVVRGRWREPVNLYVVVALPPANRKSAVFAAMTRPLVKVERALVEQSASAIVEANTTASLARAAADKAAAKAATADEDEREKLNRIALDLAHTASEITVPAEPQLIADDGTPAAITTLLAEQGGRLAVMSAEGGIFDTIAGRYSGGTADMEVFLKGHAGDLLKVNRQSRDKQYIDNPALTMALAVQPCVLEDIGRNRQFDGRGLLARFLYSMPESLVGRRKTLPDLIPDEVTDEYEKRVAALTLAMADWTDPAVLTTTPEAGAALVAFQDRIEPRLAPCGALGHISEWAGKLVGATVRIAGLLHLAEHGGDAYKQPITADTVERAIRLGEYFTVHALNVFEAMGADKALAGARTVLKHLTAYPTPSFSRRDLMAKLSRAEFPTVTVLETALGLLEEHGWVRHEPAPPREPGTRGRPPAPRYATHPQLHPN
ncbi:YfjI family protein [Kitasatospora sp. NPDC101157]|uniref:YfjI family protein n=1 Tax=Kitasatospora sp. NPDC101157 TaxID=3364098 RepID=UPI00380539FC